MRSHRLLLVLAGVSLTGVMGMYVGQPESAQAPAPMQCRNYPTEPTVVVVTPRGGRVELGWPGNFIRFPNGAIQQTANYRLSRAMDGETTLAGISLEPLDGAPSQFREPVQIRLDYSSCEPGQPARARGLLQRDSRGGPWLAVDSSGTVPGQAKAVGGYIDHLTSFAIAN